MAKKSRLTTAQTVSTPSPVAATPAESTGVLSRRKLVTGATIGAAALAVAVGAFGGVSGAEVFGAKSAAAGKTNLTAPLMVYILDAPTGDLRFLYNAKELVIHDPALVAQLAKVVQ